MRAEEHREEPAARRRLHLLERAAGGGLAVTDRYDTPRPAQLRASGGS